MKFLPVLLILFTLSYASAATYGETPTLVSYDFGELIIGEIDYDDTILDAQYIAGGGEVSINENVFMSIYFQSAIIDEDNFFGLDVYGVERQFIVGVGYHTPISDKCDFVVSGSLIFDWVEVDVEGFESDDDDTGFSLNAGVRAVPTPGLDLGLSLSYVDLYDDDYTSVNASLKYFFNDGKFGIGAVYQTSSDFDLMGVSLTWKTKK